MEKVIIITLVILLLLIIFAYVYLIVLYDKKLKMVEQRIRKQFKQRSNLVPSLFEISKKYVGQHDMVFDEIIDLRKVENLNGENYNFHEFLALETKIHHELNFIFQVLKPIKQIDDDKKFKYIKNLVAKTSDNVAKNLNIYRIISKRYNIMVKYRYFTIIGIFLPIQDKIEV